MNVPSIRRFNVGEIAITQNSSFPPNNGLLVIVTRVSGPEPHLGIEFGYTIQRIDGLNLPYVGNSPKYSQKSAACEHNKLRRPAQHEDPSCIERQIEVNV